MDHSDHMSASTATTGLAAMSDQKFLELMVPHHMMAVQMAQIELRRGKEPRVEAMAQRMLDDQQREIAQMRGWYKELTGKEIPMGHGGMSADEMAAMGMSMDMPKLISSTQPDREFMEQMIPHHAGAIVMADIIARRSKNTEIVGLARAIVAAQNAEIGQMQLLRQKLYPPLG